MGRKTLYFKANLPLLQTGLRRFMHKQMVNCHVTTSLKSLIHAGFQEIERERPRHLHQFFTGTIILSSRRIFAPSRVLEQKLSLFCMLLAVSILGFSTP